MTAGVQLQKQLEQAYPSKPHGCQRSLADLMDSRSIARVHFHRKEVLYPARRRGGRAAERAKGSARALRGDESLHRPLRSGAARELQKRDASPQQVDAGAHLRYRIDVLRHLQKEHMGAFPWYIDGEDQERFRKTCVERFRKGPRNYDEETGKWDGEFDEKGNRLTDFRECC